MRYFLGFLVTVGLIIILIFMLFKGGSKPKVATTSKTLDSYASTDAGVSLTIDGPVNAQQQHTQVKISVDRNAVTYAQINGYDGSIVKQQVYPNTQNSYANFLLALEHAGFTNGDTQSSLKDERGICPLGNRYIYELEQNAEDLQRYWSTSCGGAKSYHGNAGLTTQLFQNQMPDYGDLVTNLGI